MNTLPMYLVCAGDPCDGALLAFASTGQAARVLGHGDAWLADSEVRRALTAIGCAAGGGVPTRRPAATAAGEARRPPECVRDPGRV